MLRLHGFFRSSASFRVRIALNLKNLSYQHVGVHLRRNGGEHLTEEYRKLNPQQLVPVLQDDAATFIQSLAIIEYLDETYKEVPLLPEGPGDRSRVRSLAQVIACDMHPINNLRVLEYLRKELAMDEDGVTQWIHRWQEHGFSALEELLANDSRTGEFCHGDRPGLADICLAPQVLHAQRFGFSIDGYPTVARIHSACLDLGSFQRALPGNQPDAQ